MTRCLYSVEWKGFWELGRKLLCPVSNNYPRFPPQRQRKSTISLGQNMQLLRQNSNQALSKYEAAVLSTQPLKSRPVGDVPRAGLCAGTLDMTNSLFTIILAFLPAGCRLKTVCYVGTNIWVYWTFTRKRAFSLPGLLVSSGNVYS